MLKTSTYDGVIRFDLARNLAGRGRYWTTAYYLDGLLIDSGPAHTAGELVTALADKPLARLVNTHRHEDHIGANASLMRAHPGLEILAHPLALPILAEPRSLQPLQPYRRLFWGWPEASQANPLADGDLVKTGNFRMQVLYTPGHSPDHLCLYEPEQGWLFTGDLFVGGQERALREDGDIWNIIASLKRIAALPCNRMFPGCARVRENPEAELRAKIDYLEDLGNKVLELHDKGWEVAAIVRALCGKPMWIELFTLGNFARRHLVLSYLKGDPNFELKIHSACYPAQAATAATVLRIRRVTKKVMKSEKR
jgi:glyoxylase-like metal-dependent hydrolase (beta-lactamase superfamily II)